MVAPLVYAVAMLSSQFDQVYPALNTKSSKEGGFSINAKDGSVPTDGVMVSRSGAAGGEEKTLPVAGLTKAKFRNEMADYTQRNADTLSQRDTYVGGWKPKGPPKDAEVYIDQSRRVAPKASVAAEYGQKVADADAMTSAMDLGIAHNQLAVFDVKKGRSVNTVKGGGRPLG
jgi:hypothetical protein